MIKELTGYSRERENPMIKMLTRILLVAAVASASVVGSTVTASAATNSPAPVVLDSADLFTSSQEAELGNFISSADEKYGLTYVVETIPGLDGAAIDAYATDRANTLGVGDADSDNGVFVLISRDDREIWFALGSGVATHVTNQDVTSIVDSAVIPHFKEGDYFTGTQDGITAVGEKFVFVPAASESAQVIDLSWLVIVLITLGAGTLVLALLWLASYLLKRSARIRDEALAEKAAAEKRLEKARADKKAAEDRRDKALVESYYTDIASSIFNDSFKSRFENATSNEQRMDAAMGSPKVAALIKSPPAVAGEFDVLRLNRAYLLLLQTKIDNKLRMKPLAKNRIGSLNKAGTSIKSLADTYLEDRTEEKRELEAERAAEREYQRARAAEDARLKAEAAAYWESLTDSEKKTIRRARTKQEKIRVMQSMNTTKDVTAQPDLNILFPVLVGLYASQIQGTSSYGHSSYSGSGSSSPSYSSPSSSSSYDNTPSYGGGSFDSGSSSGGFDGGGGSW